jgi:hypothetical protein
MMERDERPPADIPTSDLLKDVVFNVSELVKKEVALAKAEAAADAQQEKHAVTALGAAALCALFGVTLLLVAIVLALALVVPGWLAALFVAAPFVVTGTVVGVVGWRERVTHPLHTLRHELENERRWVRGKLAVSSAMSTKP